MVMFKFGAWTALLCGICVVSCNGVQQKSQSSNEAFQKGPVAVVRPVQTAMQLTKPVQPASPSCFQHFPGTPGWNECFQKYMKEMADYQTKMHEYVKATGSANINEGYSNGIVHSMSSSTSNSFVGGYAITAYNMGVSSSVINSVLKLTFNTGGPIESFEKKLEGNQITFRVVTNGQQKLARIIVPQDVDVENVKFERTDNAIYVTAPTAPGGGGMFSQMSQSSSTNLGNGFTSNFVTSGGGVGVGTGNVPIPPVPIPAMPDLNNFFQNMFGNFLPSIFQSVGMGGAPQQGKARKNDNDKPFDSLSGYPIPGVWFY